MKAAFAQVLESPAPRRTAALEAACAGDAPLRAEVKRLLAEHDRVGPFLGIDSAAGLASATAANQLPQRIGAYAIIRLLGEGGMGSVYLAMQEHPRRQVALKVIRAGALTPSLVRRFEHEAEVLGRLQHPGIARIYESGSAALDPHPAPPRAFIAMEFIDGRTLVDHAAAVELKTPERLALFARVCDAVHYAHQRGVIHRDLKPANILVDESSPPQPGSGRAGDPKILDFGIAREADPSAGMTTIGPGVAQLIGTMRYMSPEQAAGDPREIDMRSDVYALGVVLYELLTGRAPYDLDAKGLAEAARIIREVPPSPVSTMRRDIRSDVQTIVTKALEKDKDARYQSAADLGADIRRHLAGEPILARSPTAIRQIRSFARRHKALSGAVAGSVVVLVLASVALGWQATIATRDRNRAQAAEARATERLARTMDVDQGMAEFAEQELSVLVGATKAREQLARMALDDLTGLAAEPGGRDQADLRLGYAHQRVGEVLLVMGHSDEALSHYRDALAVRERLAAEDPTDATKARPLAVGLWKVSEVELLMGRLDEAEAHNQRALSIHEDIASRNADAQLDRAVYLGIAHRRIADVLAARARFADAAQEYRVSLACTDAGLAGAPANRQLRRDRATTLRLLAESSISGGHPGEASPLLEECLKRLKDLSNEAAAANLLERQNIARTQLAMCEEAIAEGRAQPALELASSARRRRSPARRR